MIPATAIVRRGEFGHFYHCAEHLTYNCEIETRISSDDIVSPYNDSDNLPRLDIELLLIQWPLNGITAFSIAT